MQYKKILKHGSSKCVVLPAAWCRQLDFKLSDYVGLEVEEENKLVFWKIDRKHFQEIKNIVIHAGGGDMENGTIAKN